MILANLYGLVVVGPLAMDVFIRREIIRFSLGMRFTHRVKFSSPQEEIGRLDIDQKYTRRGFVIA